MQLTKSIHSKLCDAIDKHFAEAEIKLHESKNFMANIKDSAIPIFQRAFDGIYLPQNVNNYGLMTDTLAVNFYTSTFSYNELPEITLDKKYPLISNTLHMFKNSPAEYVRNATFSQATHTRCNDARLDIKSLEGVPQFETFLKSVKDFKNARASLKEIVIQEYNNNSSVEKLLCIVPAIKLFLAKIGVEA